MTTGNEENPSFSVENSGATNSAKLHRHVIKAMLSQGVGQTNPVDATTDLKVVQRGTPAMGVTVKAGTVVIDGDDDDHQGSYLAYTPDTDVDIDASDPSQPRIDIIVAQQRDTIYGGADDDWHPEVVQGTPGAIPVPEPTPDNAVLLAQVRVNALATTIVTANITDKRVWSERRGSPIYVRVYLGSNQSLSNAGGSNRQILVDTVTHDPHGYFDATNHEVVIPVGMAGTYRSDGGVQYASNKDGQRRALIVVGSTVVGQQIRGTDQASGVPDSLGVNGALWHFADGDIIQLQGWQDTGAALNVLAGAGASFLCLERVGD